MPAPMSYMSPQATMMLNRAAAYPGVSQAHQAVRGAMAAGAIPGAAGQRAEESAKAQAAHAAALQESPGFITRSLDKLNSLASGFFMYDFFVATGAAAVVGGIGKAFSWAGEKTGVKAMGSVGGWFGSRSDNLQAPRKYMEGVKIDQGLSKVSSDLHEKTAQWFGVESTVAKGMGHVAAGAEKAQGAINRNAGTAFRKATTAVGNVVERVDAPMHGMAGFRQRRAQRAHSTLKGRLDAAHTTLLRHEDTLRSGAQAEKAATHMGAIRSGFNELHGLMQAMPDAPTAQKAESLLGQIRESYAALHELHAEDAGMKTARKEVNAALKSLRSPLASISKNTQKAAFWRDVPGAIRKLPESMGQTDLHQAAFSGAIAVGTLAEGAHTAFGITHDLHILKRMIAAVEGKKESEISTLHALTGDVPPVIKEARHHFFGKHGPEAIAETLAAGFNLALMKKGGAGMASMAGLMMAPLAGQALADKSPMLEMYAALEKLQAAGKPIEAPMYAEFIATSYKKAEALGERNRLVQALGKEYEAAKLSAGDILKEIASGKIDERAAALEQKFAEQDKASVAQASADAKPAVGKHSAKVLEGRGGAPAATLQNVARADDAAPAASPQTSITNPVSVGKVATAPMQAVGGAA